MTLSLPHAVFWGAAALCAVAQIAILHSVFVGAPAARAAGRATATAVEHRVLETLWAVLPAIALALTLVLTWRAVDSPDSAGWRFELPDARAEPTVLLPAAPSGMPVTITPGAPAPAAPLVPEGAR